VTFYQRATVCGFVDTQTRLAIMMRRALRKPAFAAAPRLKALDEILDRSAHVRRLSISS
jgi:hypothetical protein